MPNSTLLAHDQADQAARPSQDQAHQPGPSIDLALTWAGALPMLLAVLADGMPEGKRQAEAELLRMARVADLATDARPPLNAPDLAAVLAGLRWLQRNPESYLPASIIDLATDEGTLPFPTAEGIDALCEKLNMTTTA